MTQYMQRPGGRIAYDASGEGGLVVCVPGMGDLRSIFRAMAGPLVDAGFRTVTMDLRGHGESDATFAVYDDVATGTDVLALVEELGGGPAVLVGNSMGAGAAAWAAAESPSRVAGLVLIAPFVRNPPVGLGGLLAFRLALVRPWGYAAWRSYYRSLYPGRKPADLFQHQEAMQRSLHLPGHWRAFIATTHTSHEPVAARLGEIRSLSLVVMGERDRDFRDPAGEARWIAEKLGSDLVLIPDAGHYPHAEYPEVVTPRVTEFVARAFGR